MADARITVHVDGLQAFVRALRKFAPEVQKDLFRELREVGKAVATEAKIRSSWSKRIPGSIRVGVQARRGVFVKAGNARAPHAGMYERGSPGNPGVIRHPLFGNTDRWFSTPVRPFLQPALMSKGPETVKAAEAAIESARRKVGL